ncbi:MAG: Ig-like domain-containing protein [Candidatus Palauibacterales bacterium]|nr:Ig-like domain-containing protein [Candidatus Palauibacterales bacterium]
MRRRIPRRQVLLLAVLAPAAAACGGKSVTGTGSASNPPAEPQVASVTVSPAVDTLVSIDDSVTFSTTLKDPAGNVISGGSVAWSSTEAAVATVSTDGTATARQNGTTRIVASISGKADTAVLVVEQRTVQVVMSPDSARVSTPGDTVRFSAAPQDANDHPVDGVTIEWSVSDTSVATVDSTGLATAKALGRVEVTAAAAGSGVSGTGVFRVASLGTPQIQSVSPSPIQEGQAVTITGQNFDPVAAGDSVRIDGMPAVVTSASSTSLQVTVPSYDCLPARSVAVRVATDGGASQANSDLEPAQAAVSLGVGRQAVLTDPASFCLQFGASAASERYIVGVQSLSSTVSSLTGVQITGEAADGIGAASIGRAPAARASVATRVVPRQTGGGSWVRPPSWLVAQRRAEMKIRAWERAHLDPHASIPALGGASSAPPARFSVSGSVAVDDTVALRVPDFSGDGCSKYTAVGAIVQVIGEKAIIVADTSNPANGFTQADYQSLSDQLDDQIFSTDEAYFGNPGDIDNNGHIVVLFTKAVNDEDLGVPGSYVLGFVFSGDLYPRVSATGFYCASSDEGEVYYGRVPDPDGTAGDSAVKSTRTQELSRAPQVMGHELTHLIQNGRRFAAGLGFMGSIVAEAQATLGEEVVGHAETGHMPYQNLGADVIFATTGADSVAWYLNKFTDLAEYFGFKNRTARVDGAPEQCGWWQSDPTPCASRSLWYGVGWSFLRWVSDQYGPSYPGGEQGLQQNLIADPGSGLQMVADVVGVPVANLMARWSAALYVDDRIPSPDPALTFPSWNLNDFEQHTVATANLEPTPETFGDWTTTADVRASSAAYVAVDGSGRPATAVRVRDASGNPLPSYMQVWVVRMW